MTVAEFTTFWHTINKTEMHTKYYYNNKQIYLYQLKTINKPLHSLKINITCDTLQQDHIEIYSDTNLTYNQEKLCEILKTRIPFGSYIFILNIYLN